MSTSGAPHEVAHGLDAAAPALSREARQRLGLQSVMALGATLRNAHVYAADDNAFAPPLHQLQDSVLQLLSADGFFELHLAEGGVFVNHQAVRIDPASQPLLESLAHELEGRGLAGLQTQLAPPLEELRALVHVFTRQGTLGPGDRGDPRRPLQVFQLLRVLREPPRGISASDPDGPLVEAYAHAAFFVDRTIEELRRAGEPIPAWTMSRVVQELVDLQARRPARFLQLARAKPPPEEYWGQHAANVAVLAISFGARLGLSRGRRHDLGMAALLHDVGVAALPASLLTKNEPLSEREMVAVRSSPLFAARAILRDREVHAAALERAMAAYECHLDLVPPPGEALPQLGLSGRVLALCEAFDALTTERTFRPARTPAAALRVLQTELLFRFDPQLLDLFVRAVEPLLY